MAAAKKKSASKKITPMMQQYLEIRQKLAPDTLLLFRLGDFYEMFEKDAERGAQILGITLTQRGGQAMAGIPFHAADNYIQKALNQGIKVAIVDQLETPQAGKIVKRGLTRILTPGTTLEDHQVDAKTGNYLLALHFLKADKKNYNIRPLCAAWLDLTTGDFQIASDAKPDNLLPLISSIDPKEILVSDDNYNDWIDDSVLHSFTQQFQHFASQRTVNKLPDYHFDQEFGAKQTLETLGVLNLNGFGIEVTHPALACAGALINYATENLCSKPKNLTRISEYSSQNMLLLDPSTLRNLEIFKSATGTREGTLIASIDGTVTAPGARLLEKYLSAPSLELKEIERRQNCVGEFLEAPAYAAELHDYLKCIRDIQRILSRLQNRIRNPRELGGIRDTLRQLPYIQSILEQFEDTAVKNLYQNLKDFPELRTLLENAVADDLPSQMRDGGYIRDGYDETLDHLRHLQNNSQKWLQDLETSEQERTGIKKLRIKSNNAFGYFIEVTKANIHLVPEEYHRKQTTVNAERYTTPELKEKEKEILSAGEQSIAREEELFRDLVAAVLEQANELEKAANILAQIDLFIGWAKVAREWNYAKPQLNNSTNLEIINGRHPVVEQMLRKQASAIYSSNSTFIPNDTTLSSNKEQIAIITGPNMAGKSTYIRQVSLIVLMAQVGCWVPAESCCIGLVDKIFSRVGASDELAKGNSTFMVEMNETANILNNTTEKSLIILDEIGRGTSTYDGLSIAWSVVEHLHGKEGEKTVNAFENTGPRTLFATHYHELTQIERQLDRIENYSVTVKEWNDEIIFVREVRKGAADRSYGIQVARLAGIPSSVINRAKEILEKLEADDSSHNLLKKRAQKIKDAQAKGEDIQLQLF